MSSININRKPNVGWIKASNNYLLGQTTPATESNQSDKTLDHSGPHLYTATLDPRVPYILSVTYHNHSNSITRFCLISGISNWNLSCPGIPNAYQTVSLNSLNFLFEREFQKPATVKWLKYPMLQILKCRMLYRD